MQTCGIKHKFCESTSLAYANIKGDLIVYKCLCCKRIYQTKFGQNGKKRFTNTYNTNYSINKFTFLLQKGVLPI